jgi:hypothetical protein
VGRVMNDPFEVISFLTFLPSSFSISVSESRWSRSSKLVNGNEVLCSTADSTLRRRAADSSNDRGILTSSAVFHGSSSASWL